MTEKQHKRMITQVRKQVIEAINSSEYIFEKVEEEVYLIIKNILEEAKLPMGFDVQDEIRNGIRLILPWASRKRATSQTWGYRKGA